MRTQPSQTIDQEALSAVIDLDLYSGIIDMVANTSAEVTSTQSTAIHTNLFYLTQTADVQAAHSIKYFGELLERYGEKIGTDARTVRAIALALAHTKDFVTNNMFVGAQRRNFIRDIRNLAKTDLFIKGALFLLDPADVKVYEELVSHSYAHTIDAIYMLGILADREAALRALRPQLESLLGANRDMSAYQNSRIFAWLISVLAPFMKKDKVRNSPVLKSLMEFPVSNVKPDSKHWLVLRENGYTAEEIAYLNYSILFHSPVPKTIYHRSIVGVKIAINFCTTMLTSTETHSESTYEYMTMVMNLNTPLAVKVHGHETMYDAVCDTSLHNADTLLWIFGIYHLNRRFKFEFEPLDSKWDKLAEKLEPGEYLNLFDYQLLRLSDDGRTAERIAKYESLTSRLFVETFMVHRDHRETVFALLIEERLLDPIALFDKVFPDADAIEEAGKKDSDSILMHFGRYINGVTTRPAFLLTQHALSKYPMASIKSLFYSRQSRNFASGLFSEPAGSYHSYGSYSSYKLNIRRDFLSVEEMKQLLSWVDEYTFMCNAKAYDEFCLQVISSSDTEELVPFDERRAMYMHLAEMGTLRGRYIDALKQKYLTEDEREKEQEQEARKKREADIESDRKERADLEASLLKDYGNGSSPQQLEKFYDRYDFSARRVRIALQIIHERMSVSVFSDCPVLLTKTDLLICLRLLSYIAQAGILTIEDAVPMINDLSERMARKDDNDGIEVEPAEDDEEDIPGF